MARGLTRGALIALIAGSGVAGAQQVSPQCGAGSPTALAAQDACQKAVDVFQFMAPQLGVSVVGGNATIGQGGALGGLGRFTFGVRATGLRARVPRVDAVTPAITGARVSDYRIDDKYFALPTVESGIGLFRGFPLGVTDVLALDALVSATYAPSVSERNVDISVPDGSLKVGYGARLGILQESFVTPSLAVSYFRRDLPTVDITGTVGSDSLRAHNISAKNDAYRVIAGKNFYFFGLAAGVGRDRVRSASDVNVVVRRAGTPASAGPIAIRQDITRTTVFLDASLNLPLIRVAAEIGRTSGGDIATYNTFSGKKAADALTFASVGVGIGF